MNLRRLAYALLVIPVLALAGPMNIISGARHFSQSIASEWADVYVTDIANVGTGLATSGRKVGIKVGTTFTGLGQALTSGNGAAMDIVVGGSFDGKENAVRIYPPTACVPSPCNETNNAQYAAWATGVNLWSNGATDIAQMNFRVLRYYGTRYFDLAPPAKSWGFLSSMTLGPDPNRRLAVFDIYEPAWNPSYRYPFVTVTTVAGMYNPVVAGWAYVDSGPDTTKMMRIGATIDHAASPPQTGGEWICFEDVMDLRQNRGNPNGLHKLVATWRDGTQRVLEYPLNWDGGWTFPPYMGSFEGIGFYFNRAGSAHADNYLLDSHLTFVANLPNTDTYIGCPPGFRQ